MKSVEGISRREQQRESAPIAIEMVVAEVRELHALAKEKHKRLENPEEISHIWQRVELLKAHVQSMIVEVAGSGTVVAGMLSGVLLAFGEKNPAVAVVAIAGVLDALAVILGKIVTKDAARVEAHLQTDRLHAAEGKIA